jgi:hypothetical protein
MRPNFTEKVNNTIESKSYIADLLFLQYDHFIVALHFFSVNLAAAYTPPKEFFFYFILS